MFGDEHLGDLGPSQEEWHPVGSDYYARHHLYTMEWTMPGGRGASQVNLEYLRSVVT